MAATDGGSAGPSKTPHPSAQAYCVPDRFTPSSRTGVPDASTRWLPDTETARARPPVDVEVSVVEVAWVGADVVPLVAAGVEAVVVEAGVGVEASAVAERVEVVGTSRAS